MIYRIKRFSREKSYSILTDLYHSGAKRTAKKWIGRARVKAAKPFYKKSLEQYQKGIEAEQKAANKVDISPESRKKLRAALGQRAKELDARINTKLPEEIRGGHSWVIDSKTLEEYLKEFPDDHRAVRKLKRSAKRGKASAQIIRAGNNSDIQVGHELGHIENTKGSLTDKLVSSMAGDPKVRTKFQRDISEIGLVGNHGDSGLKSSVRSILRNKLIRKEEANATKMGVKILKDAGITEKELKEAKKYLDECGKTYKHYGKSSTLTTIGNTLNIPSRRSKSIVEQLDR